MSKPSRNSPKASAPGALVDLADKIEKSPLVGRSVLVQTQLDRFHAIEAAALAELNTAGLAAPNCHVDETAVSSALDSMPKEGREGKRRAQLFRELATYLSARRVIGVLEDIGTHESREAFECDLVRVIDAAFFTAVNMLRPYADIGLSQKQAGQKPREKSKNEKRADGWRAHDRLLAKTESNQSERARIIAKEAGVGFNTVRAALRRRLVGQA